MPNRISIRIDGEIVQARSGQTILEAASENNKSIPSLCNMKGLRPVGACRLCLIQVEGLGRMLPACTTPVQDGMSVTTDNAKLRSYRQMIIELLLAERNHICAVCVANGHCELQSAAAKLGVMNTRYAYRYPNHKVDLTHSRFTLDHNRCILCSRCVRACADVEGAHVWEIAGRGIGSQLVCELNRGWGESRHCTACGKCVQSCPTGALAEKGFAVEEMTKKPEPVSRIASFREVRS